MSYCSDCREALSSEPTEERCARVFEVEKGSLKCEGCGASELGPVADDEILNFLVCDPPFSDGALSPENLIDARDAADNGVYDTSDFRLYPFCSSAGMNG